MRKLFLFLPIFCACASVKADALDPLEFAPIGPLNLTAGSYFILTGGTAPQLVDSASNVLFTGVFFNQNVPVGSNYWAWDPVVAVFDFDAVAIQSNVTVSASGSNTLAMLSRTGFVLNGIVDVSGTNGANGIGSLGGTGDGLGGSGGAGGGKGGDGGTGSPSGSKGEDGAGPGGGYFGMGAYGGTGGNGSRGNGAGFGGEGGGGFGGLVPYSDYGDLHYYLQGGAGGGGTGTDFALSKGAGGGGGGGGIEVGAATALVVNGRILATGGFGGSGGSVLAGGGSGGGIFLHAPLIQFGPGSILDASAGNYDGGGGRILILTNSLQGQAAVSTQVLPGDNYGASGVVEYGPLTNQFQVPQLTISRLNPAEIEVCWPTVTNVTYQLETNAMLDPNTWGPAGGAVGGNGQTNCASDAVSPTQRFYRLRVTLN